MFKKIFIICLLFGAVFIPKVFCLAQDPLQNIAEKSGYSTDVTEYSLSQTIGGYIKAVLGFLGVIFFALTFYAGFLWLTAGGDEGKIEKAKEIITAATIGLIIIFMAYGITAMVLNLTRQASAPPTSLGN
ncbi:MAG TPA: hypothetical protein P5230_02595 [Candidatus Magasanikbacteria bacterium]|nr:hypothetical protein [Candidatus Magasanikbacteria bacterium]